MPHSQMQLLQEPLDPQDVVYTPVWAVEDMISFFQPTGIILDPCKGEGAFIDRLPVGSLWCEISEGRDFYAFNERVDWIIGNPPYAQSGKWLRHSFDLADNIVYLLPCDKPFISYSFLLKMRKWGGIKHMRIYGSGKLLNFPMGFAVGALHFVKDFHGGMETSFYD